MSTWSQVLSRIEQVVDRTEYDTWLAPTRLVAHKGDTLDVAVPSQRYVDEIRELFGTQIRAILNRASVISVPVDFQRDSSIARASALTGSATPKALATASAVMSSCVGPIPPVVNT